MICTEDAPAHAAPGQTAPCGSAPPRIVMVSNRLPVVLERSNGGFEVRPGSGGLVTALAPVLRRWGGVWVGWTGVVTEDGVDTAGLVTDFSQTAGYELREVQLSTQDRDLFYQGYSNEIVWPLFHDLQSRCNFVPEYWTAYLHVKQSFAGAVEAVVRPGDFVFIQDYHLMGLGRRLRDGGLENRLAFFLHIPFPPPDIFCKLPWRNDVLSGLLAYDVIGFQTPRDLENFMDCVRKLIPRARRHRRRGVFVVEHAGHTAQIGAFPIGIDYDEFAVPARDAEVTARVKELRREMGTPQVLLGVDRLDYTKGITYRLRALELALKRYPEIHRQVALFQVVIPSRQGVPEYQELQGQIERQVAQINGAFTQPGWVPIHYVFRSVERRELLAMYRTADVALVTPLKDGMNLVAKEYCACQVEGDGVLILSEFAGAACQLGKHAVLVNPYDLDGAAEAVYRATQLTRAERRPAMRAMQRIIRREDIYWWVQRFFAACGIDVAMTTRAAREQAAS